MRIKTIAAALCATAACGIAAIPAQAGAGIRDRPIVLQPGLCAGTFENSLNQFILLGTNSPIKWSGGVRSCSTTDETVHVHFEDMYPGSNACSVAPFDSAPVTLRSGETKGVSAETPEPTCEGYFYFRVTAVDANGTNASPDGGSVTYTVHVAPKT